jgi:hypothetical protein
MTDTSSFRLYLDTEYDVEPWPFAAAWRATLADLPAHLPGGVEDFSLFLPEDHYNRAHGPLARERSAVRTEMAVYRDGDALVVLLRMWPGTPLPLRYAPPQEDGAGIMLMADRQSDRALYVGVDPRSRIAGLLWRGLQPDSSDTRELCEAAAPGTFDAASVVGPEGGWTAGFYVPLASVPERDPNGRTLAFTAGRIWGETAEASCWATSITWAPRPEEMGTLHLGPRPEAAAPRLHRADLTYDAEAEQGELNFTIANVPSGKTAPVTVTINSQATHHDATGVVRQSFTPEDGTNDLVVKVGEQRSLRIPFEKWSGHQLFPKYASPHPLPALDDLQGRFQHWHEGKEKIYVAPGTWANYSAEHYGLDHHCAFVMEPYALASLYLQRAPVYLERVQESCERILQAQQANGCLLCYHFSDNPQPFEGGAFAQGSASEALCLGYRICGDQRYLDAASLAAEAYALYRLENNTNYMAFVLSHLAELYELTGEQRHLDRALWYAQYGVLRGMNPSGAYPGHNYYTAYGNITLKGLAKLLRVLPPSQDGYPLLKERVLRFTNQILARQRVNGLFDGLNRMYFGYQHTVAGLFEVARALPEVADSLAPVLAAMVEARPNAGAYEPEGLDLALTARFLREKAAAVNEP